MRPEGSTQGPRRARSGAGEAPAGHGRAAALFPRLLPPVAPGMTVGLMGGSFNPPHEGHVLASRIALRRLGLDRVWWLVTPGNPLKDNARLPSLDERMAQARRIAADPRIDVTGLEAAIGTRYTFDTVDALTRRCPGVRFVWLMGADNLAQFARWQRWRDIAARVPIAIIDRPGATLKATRSQAALALARFRLPEAKAAALARCRPPAWVFLHDRRSPLSSTMLRQKGRHASIIPPGGDRLVEKDQADSTA